MTTISAGTRVERGYYFNTKTWMLQNVAQDGEMLPGASQEKYLVVPVLLALVVAPLMGAAFLMFLPFVGIALTAQAAFRPVARLFGRSATELAATLQPGLQPGEAHLTGKPADEKAGAETAEPAAEDETAKLEREIADRRRSR
ncbi:MAG: hypothetical protein ACXWK6_14795 [Myxococcaceae bacterium]